MKIQTKNIGYERNHFGIQIPAHQYSKYDLVGSEATDVGSCWSSSPLVAVSVTQSNINHFTTSLVMSREAVSINMRHLPSTSQPYNSSHPHQSGSNTKLQKLKRASVLQGDSINESVRRKLPIYDIKYFLICP